MNSSQREAITQILDTAEALDRRRLRAHRIEEPEHGSDLAEDDKVFERMPLSEVARLSRRDLFRPVSQLPAMVAVGISAIVLALAATARLTLKLRKR